MRRDRFGGVLQVTIAAGQIPFDLAAEVACRVRGGGAQLVACDTDRPACDGIIHGAGSSEACRVERLLEWNRRSLGLPVLLLAPDGAGVRQLLELAGHTVTWLPVSDHGEVYALGASIQRHVRRSAAAHVQRLIIHATACPHPQVHRITRDFLTALVDGPGAPGLGTFLRRSGVAPRTAERIWSRAGLPHPKRFLDLTLLLFLATESARTGDTITHVARDLHVGRTTLRRLRQRTPGLRSVRDLYHEAGAAAVLRAIGAAAD
jgi:hypothetical protein